MRDKAVLVLLVALVMVMVTSGCTITHQFGPFSGTVVEAETGEPIEGAVVLIGFYTKGNSVGGWVYRFADAVEALTDAKGEFHFPPKRVTLYRSMSIWDKRCRISIFKPGYGAYPNNSKTFSVPNLEQSRFIPENERITFHLHKLLTLAKRKENHYKIETPGGITNDKMPNLRKLIDKDSETIFRMEMEKNK